MDDAWRKDEGSSRNFSIDGGLTCGGPRISSSVTMLVSTYYDSPSFPRKETPIFRILYEQHATRLFSIFFFSLYLSSFLLPFSSPFFFAARPVITKLAFNGGCRARGPLYLYAPPERKMSDVCPRDFVIFVVASRRFSRAFSARCTA